MPCRSDRVVVRCATDRYDLANTPMYLQRLKISNFRLLENIELKFSEEITLLAGPNNVGKSKCR